MIVYIVDRSNRVVGTATKEIQEDTYIDELSGVKSLEITLDWTDALNEVVQAGNYFLIGGNSESMFQISQVTRNTKNQTIQAYAEDAGLDLIQKTALAWSPTSAQTIVQAVAVALNGLNWSVHYSTNTSTSLSASNLQFEEGTVLERLQSIASAFDCEISISFKISGLSVVNRTIEFSDHRGVSEATTILRAGHEIDEITIIDSVEELATGYLLYGKEDTLLSSSSGYSSYAGKTITPEDTTITGVRNYSYLVEGNLVKCIDMMENWANSLDPVGLIYQAKHTEYSTAKELVSYAIRELEKKADIVRSYEATFLTAPEDINCGDVVKIVDSDKGIFLEARVTKTTRSYLNGSYSVELDSCIEIANT